MDAQTLRAQPAAAATTDIKSILLAMFAWLRHNLTQVVMVALAGGLISWLVNVYLMATAGGYKDVTPGSPITGKGNVLNGSLIWAIGSMVLFGILGYWRAVGTKRFWQGIITLPQTIGALFHRDGQAVYSHLLWGAAISMVTLFFISPWLSAVFALGLFAAMPTMLGVVFSGFLFRAWSTLANLFAPKQTKSVSGPVAMTVGILGACAALALGFFITNTSLKLVLAVGCAAAALMLSRRGTPPTLVIVLLLIPLAEIVLDLLHPLFALADDGGANEIPGKHTIINWAKSPGAGTVMTYGAAGGGGAATGGPLGWILGNFLAQHPMVLGQSVPAGPSLPWELPPEQDPGRITTYKDFPEWAVRTYNDAVYTGTLSNVDPLVVNYVNTHVIPRLGPDPNTWEGQDPRIFGKDPAITERVYSGNDALDILKKMGLAEPKTVDGKTVWVPKGGFPHAGGQPTQIQIGESEDPSTGQVTHVMNKPIHEVIGAGYKIDPKTGGLDPDTIAIVVNEAEEGTLTWQPAGQPPGRQPQPPQQPGQPQPGQPPQTQQQQTQQPGQQPQQPQTPQQGAQGQTKTPPPPAVGDSGTGSAPPGGDTGSVTETAPPAGDTETVTKTSPPAGGTENVTESKQPTGETQPPSSDTVRHPTNPEELSESLKQPGTTVVDPEAAGSHEGKLNIPEDAIKAFPPNQQKLIKDLNGSAVEFDHGKITIRPTKPIEVDMPLVGPTQIDINDITVELGVNPDGHLEANTAALHPKNPYFNEVNVTDEVNESLKDFNESLDKNNLKVINVTVDDGQIRIETGPK